MHHDTAALGLLDILALLGAALLFAKILAGLLERFSIPNVLVELIVGIVLGNLTGKAGQAYLALEHSPIVEGFSEMGVLFLLFLVGLETNLNEIGKVGKDAFLAAIYGVAAPFILAFAVIPLLFTFEFPHILFLAAALTATSVGITARVLQETGKLKSVSGQVILGAAVIDDILGVIVLTVCAGIVKSGSFSWAELGILLAKVAAFGVVIGILRRYLLRGFFNMVRPLETNGMLTVMLLSLCLLASWVAKKFGLEGIIGAFALGIALDAVFFKRYADAKHGLEELIKPVVDFFAPIFFIFMGMGVKLDALLNPEAFGLGVLLIACGILGKLVCGWGLSRASVKRGGDRLLVGVGMMPRGEVGLIFAAIGQQIGVLQTADYSAIVMMVAVTTLLAPALIVWRARS